MSVENKDQKHPQESRDRKIIDEKLKRGNPADDYNLAELARLRIRYCGFPGAREIQQELDEILQQWQMTEEELFEKTRQLHAANQIYKDKVRGKKQNSDDWS